jgi:hypothetical protein
VGPTVECASSNTRVLRVALLVVSRARMMGIASFTSVCPNFNGVRRRGIRDPYQHCSAAWVKISQQVQGGGNSGGDEGGAWLLFSTVHKE